MNLLPSALIQLQKLSRNCTTQRKLTKLYTEPNPFKFIEIANNNPKNKKGTRALIKILTLHLKGSADLT